MPDNWDFSETKRPRRVFAPDASATPVLTSLLCALCVALTLAWWGQDVFKGTPLAVFGGFAHTTADDIWRGKYYGLFTAFFLHGSIMHLLFNMMWFLQLGRLLERTLAPLTYLGFLLGAALVGSCAELAFDGETGVGASGVVYAMFGLMWAGRGAFAEWRLVATRNNLNLFLGWGVFCLVGTWLHWLNIANAAHFGGLLFGLCLGWLFYAPRRRPLAALPLVLLAALCVLSVTWLPWSPAWNWDRGNTAYRQKNFAAALFLYQRALREGGEESPLWNNVALACQGLADEAGKRGDAKERDAALAESDAALSKSNAAPKEQDAALAESDAALSKSNAAPKEQDAPPSATNPTPEDAIQRLREKMRSPNEKK